MWVRGERPINHTAPPPEKQADGREQQTSLIGGNPRSHRGGAARTGGVLSGVTHWAGRSERGSRDKAQRSLREARGLLSKPREGRTLQERGEAVLEVGGLPPTGCFPGKARMLRGWWPRASPQSGVMGVSQTRPGCQAVGTREGSWNTARCWGPGDRPTARYHWVWTTCSQSAPNERAKQQLESGEEGPGLGETLFPPARN